MFIYPIYYLNWRNISTIYMYVWNILHEIRKRKANWIGHILRRNCLLERVIEGKIKGEMEVTRRRGRRRKKLLDDLKYRRGYSHLKEEALDPTMWRNRFGGGVGHVVRQNTEWMNVYCVCSKSNYTININVRPDITKFCNWILFWNVVSVAEDT